MSDIDVDVRNLFRKIGGVEPTYQELRRQSRTDQARERWPLLHSLQVDAEGKPAPVESDLVFPPQGKPEKITEIRPSQKSGISKLFKSLETERALSETGVLVQPSPKEPLSGLVESKGETRPLLFGKTPEAAERSSGLFSRLFESRATPSNSLQSLFDRLEKS